MKLAYLTKIIHLLFLRIMIYLLGLYIRVIALDIVTILLFFIIIQQQVKILTKVFLRETKNIFSKNIRLENIFGNTKEQML